MNRWDIFCRVVDNYGDIGVCWRLSRQLTIEQGACVRLWVDRLDAFAVMCPAVRPGVMRQVVDGIEICAWEEDFPATEPADVVIEAFACEIPESYRAAMVRRMSAGSQVPPVWINLEYLSAEEWVDGCHGLASPGSETSLRKFFYFPGFTSDTGGLLRERGLLKARDAFRQQGIRAFWERERFRLPSTPRKDTAGRASSGTLEADPVGTAGEEDARELRVSLFCYENPVLPALLECWAAGPAAIRLLVAPGWPANQVWAWSGMPLEPGDSVRRGALIIQALPFLPQAEYDELLWACDVNFVRGEDSFVRAQWAARPFVWQIYPQTEGTHLVKMEAFLKRYLVGFPQAEAVSDLWQLWNGAAAEGSPDDSKDLAIAWKNFVSRRTEIDQHGREWAERLDRTGDLANNLAEFVMKRRAGVSP